MTGAPARGAGAAGAGIKPTTPAWQYEDAPAWFLLWMADSARRVAVHPAMQHMREALLKSAARLEAKAATLEPTASQHPE